MVSVVIPVYNVEKYIKLCLLSLENQEFKDFEVIIVNDGSMDTSASIVEDYISTSQMNIKLIHQENSGVSVARNTGIEHASGRYICFIDSDDMLTSNYLSEMVNALKNENCDMAICGVRNISEDSKSTDFTSGKSKILKMDSQEALTKFLHRDITSGVWAILINKEIIDKNDLKFAVGYRYSEDIEMIFKMLVHCDNIASIKKQLYLYRVRNSSVMSLVDDKRLDGFKLMKDLETYLDRVCPTFAQEFKRFGVSRWIWATLWQVAMASSSYSEFRSNVTKYEGKLYMKKLFSFPKIVVSLSAMIFYLSPFTYYFIVKKSIAIMNSRKFKNSSFT